MTSSRERSRRAGGFTLIEVLLVLVILVILASFAVVQYAGVQRRANIQAAKTQVGLCKTALQTYQLAMGDYPSTAQGLRALRYSPSDAPNANKWDGPYLDADVPLDPWYNPYQYLYPGQRNPDSFDVWSFGPDCVNGTDDDIGNWTQELPR
jgi:general secretion pathway protein G